VYREGVISPAQAAGVLRSILASGIGPQVVVSPGGLLWRERLASQVAAGAADGADAGDLGGALAARYVSTPFVPPQTDVEQKLALLWQHAVGVEQVGLDDDFQELGISSIAAVRLAARVSSVFGMEVSVREFFDWRTLRAAARAVQTAQKRQ
jgi:acyl carrier protein